MADDDQTTTDEPLETAPGPKEPKELREAYEREKARNAALLAEVEAGRKAQRELAFTKAGIPGDHPVAQLFTTSYEGEMETEAIKTAWDKLGIQLTPPRGETPPTEDQGAQERKELQDARREFSGEGAPPGTEPDVDPIEKAIADGHGAGERGSRQAMAAYAQTIVNAAVAGDPRVMHKGTIDDDTRVQWLEDARQRQIRNRDRARGRA
jgi:hypothetical protein